MAKRYKMPRDVIMARLYAGDSNDRVLDAVKKAFPSSTMGLATINWYRNGLRREGEPILSEQEAKKI